MSPLMRVISLEARSIFQDQRLAKLGDFADITLVVLVRRCILFRHFGLQTLKHSAIKTENLQSEMLK